MMTATSQDELEHLPTEYLSFLPHSSQGQLLSVASTMMLCCVMRFWRTFTRYSPGGSRLPAAPGRLQLHQRTALQKIQQQV